MISCPEVHVLYIRIYQKKHGGLWHRAESLAITAASGRSRRMAPPILGYPVFPMFLIAAIHLLWLLLAPVGIVMLSLGFLRWKRWQLIVGVVAMVASLPAIYFCS